MTRTRESVAPAVAPAAVTAQDVAAEAPPTPLARPRRADAAENRQRILQAAEDVFATEGITAGVDSVAARAGVGVGTVYRNFPNKEALCEAIVTMRIEELIDAAQRQPDDGDPDTFFCFMRLFADLAMTKRDFVTALGDAGIDVKSRCSESFDRLFAGIERLLHDAQRSGTVRADVDANEVVGLVVGTCLAQERGPSASTARMLDVVFDGLRTRSGR